MRPARGIQAVVAAAWLAGCASPYGRVPRPDADEPAQVAEIRLPPQAPSISQRFRPRYGHDGIDLRLRVGTPVLAPAPGVVLRTGVSPMYGRTLQILHGGGTRTLCTRYLHLREVLVRPGERVRRGQVVARSGRSGLLAGGLAHLHFETRRCRPDGSDLGAVDPQRFWVEGPGRVTCFRPGRRWPADPLRLTYPAPCRAPVVR